jgi:subtilisin
MSPDLPPDLRDITNATGQGVRVLVLDSGIETTHPALAPGPAIRSFRVEADGPDSDLRRVVEDEGGTDVFGHGTAVASIIRRYAPDATIDSVKVIGRPLGWSHFILAAIHWGIDRSYDIINCSFTTQSHDFLAEYKAAVDRAFCQNVQIVSACNNKEYWRVEYPGSFPTVISTDYADLKGLTLRRRPGQLVEFLAPGHDIRVAWKNRQYRLLSGSSFAAPHLTAIVARLRQLHPQSNACQLKTILYALADSGASIE